MEETTVKAIYAASWPTTAIAANTRINDITINTSAATTEQSPLAIEQALIDIFKNLSSVSLTLGNNIQNIVSIADVELTNLISLSASATAHGLQQATLVLRLRNSNGVKMKQM